MGRPMADAEEKQDEQKQEGGAEAQSEEELRAQLEEEIRKVKIEDVILQSVVSILNLAARRIAKDDERDLEQGKLGIDAAAAIVDFVPEEAKSQLNEAIAELRLLYVKHAEGGGDTEAGEKPDEPAEKPSDEKTEPEQKEPERKSGEDSGLWTPPGS
jgi:hypothetical protein